MLKPMGWWLAVIAVDLRCGLDRLLVKVQAELGREAGDGGAYVFRNRSSTRIKALCVDAQGMLGLNFQVHSPMTSRGMQR